MWSDDDIAEHDAYAEAYEIKNARDWLLSEERGREAPEQTRSDSSALCVFFVKEAG